MMDKEGINTTQLKRFYGANKVIRVLNEALIFILNKKKGEIFHLPQVYDSLALFWQI